MSGKAYHFALSRDDAKRLFRCKGDEALRQFVTQLAASDQRQRNGKILENDPCWKTLHRCLSDGTLEPSGGEFPLSHVFLGGRQLADGEDLIVALVRPDAVPIVAQALAEWSRDDLVERYRTLVADHHAEQSNVQNGEQSWSSLATVRDFFQRAAENTEAILFTVIS